MSSYNSEEEVWKLPEQDFTWDVGSELALYQALMLHKPAGINKHFNVALVSEILTEELGKPVLAGSIWKKLQEMFDLKAIEDREEAIPFSLETKEFCLPRKDFEILILERRGEWKHRRMNKHYMSRTPTTPKSEGSESRSSPYYREDLDLDYSDDDIDSDADADTDDEDDDDVSDHCELESIKSDKGDEDESRESDKEQEALLAQAREEIANKLTEKLREEEKERAKLSQKTSRVETKVVKEEDKIATKRHSTRSTPNNTPNKRRK
eukprot:TRINITY_DN44950_c0_g1_i1.p1 TRINITY_DN44950_c0_g1~~TRINITY_DN44950_c0_g1_i1.p1  ORF type:complete len:266 (+),score=37.37 TRINITY_DN44950_c0_g1_i1:37-834(+)